MKNLINNYRKISECGKVNLNWIQTISNSGISIGLPVKKDVKTPFLVIGAVGSTTASLIFLSASLSIDFLVKFSSKLNSFMKLIMFIVKM